MDIALVWLRQDLRLHDNPALFKACQRHQQVIPFYCYDDKIERSIGEAQCWWLHHSLTALSNALTKHKLSLVLRRGNPLLHLSELIKKHDIQTVYWNRCYEPDTIVRDKHLKATLIKQGVTVHTHSASLLFEPWDIQNKQGSYFKVFTPFWRHCCTKTPREPLPLPKKNNVVSMDIATDHLNNWNLLPTQPNWAACFKDYWQPGEKGAMQALNHFLECNLSQYKLGRDRPDHTATSRLSPHLHFGEISSIQIWYAVHTSRAMQQHLVDSECFLSEIGWREFSYHLLYHFPQLPHKNFRPAFDSFAWRNAPKQLRQWQRGLTGFPIVDAGMRELWATGYMHNRVRMICASFLTKDLLIDWRCGEQWFWNTLLDADLANNAASWQWVAGSGADAAPYFRIFNPTTQAQKFDPNGDYIAKWVSELATLPVKWRHQPNAAPIDVLTKAGIRLGEDYPKPIVDHKVMRELALERYKAIRS